MKRYSAAALTVLLLWAMGPAFGEIFENAVHLLTEGHTAHAAPDGDDHGPTGTEHGCTGAVHLCSCCVSVSCLPTHTASDSSAEATAQVLPVVSAHAHGRSGRGVYHPPRA